MYTREQVTQKIESVFWSFIRLYSNASYAILRNSLYDDIDLSKAMYTEDEMRAAIAEANANCNLAVE